MHHQDSHRLEIILETIVAQPTLHAKWINTLSYLENCGACKIALSEHPTQVHELILKHAAEEFRHAYFFKSQLKKIHTPDHLDDYRLSSILGKYQALHYLHRLEAKISRLLKKELDISRLKHAAYLLVTYVIEKRAGFLYPLYQAILQKCHSPLSVRGIIAEEDQHLEEISKELDKIAVPETIKTAALAVEQQLYEKLLEKIEVSIF